MSAPAVAIAIPAYNEADGIGGFLREIDRVLAVVSSRVHLVVVDDASADATGQVVGEVASELDATVELVTNPVNRGHGPSLMTAYRRAAESGAEYVLQVDGDGQLHGSDLRRILVLLMDESHAACGVRRFRQDSWFRMRMTAVLRGYVRASYGVRARDANCPLRGYETSLLATLLDRLDPGCLIPNLYLTVLAARAGYPLVEVDVSHRVRRGASAVGTTWGRGVTPIPWRLLRFSARALAESWSMRDRLVAEPARDRLSAAGR